MNVYLKAFPDHASELVQYNHVIYTAALTFQWENVYAYDKEFRMHLSNFPNRSWSVILQQAWTMCLKDRLSQTRWEDKGKNRPKKEACKRFNKGLCKKGLGCKYEHRCTVPECGKFSHGAHICRLKAKGDDTTSTPLSK